ncbi:MAG: carboxypeptidase-like regulatory domain-containing protein, partial [Ignavibacteria bacterium]|nr:carboxypeptidase-like regulatory domain-containing protein [Ignavibacteria bacterium]
MLKLFTYVSFLFFFIYITPIYSQGVTTASISGYVSNTEGEYLPNANVIAVHVSSGTQYGASTRENGLFNIPNMKIGGPYTITVSFVGYITQKQEGVFLNLGQNVRLDFVLSSESLQLGEVVV